MILPLKRCAYEFAEVEPDYDSKWTSINTGIDKEFVHELGGNPDDYVVDLQFMDDIFYDVNQIYYGGNLSYETDGSIFREGAFWSILDASTVNLIRQEKDHSLIMFEFEFGRPENFPPTLFIYRFCWMVNRRW